VGALRETRNADAESTRSDAHTPRWRAASETR
jgi:hypothetical protein